MRRPRRVTTYLTSPAALVVAVGCGSTPVDVAPGVADASTDAREAGRDAADVGAGGAGGDAGGGGVAGAGGSSGVGGAGGAAGSGSSGGSGGSMGPGPTIAGCPVFPVDDEWNRDVSTDPVDPASDAFIAAIQANGSDNLHPDFGSDASYGIPYNVVGAAQPKVAMTFEVPDESDPGPYPFPPPPGVLVEASSDAHVLVVDRDACVLYETSGSVFQGGGWSCYAGARFDLRSNVLRPEGWTSADAAGLPIFAGLVRYDEVAAGEIRHALRFTVSKTQAAYVHPATHFASSSTDATRPPMGMRVRLKASFDLAGFTGASRVILVALKRHGMFVADNGSNWYLTGASDPRFDDDDLGQLKSVPGTAFEVVKLGALHR